MAEAPLGFDLRRIGLIAGVSLVVLFAVLFLTFRGCTASSRAGRNLSVVYSNLDLRDAANVVARLKELGIPYEIRDEGQAIAVPKNRADEARLSLAEKNLPAGGVVGWEIFDESKLGATDFDRRIQLIRAISGELCRTIRTIQAIDDVRVQIVLPETKLFAAQSAPVTASVLLRLKPGAELSPEKINGIVHLVASSVENLQPENVTVVDNTGRILTVKPTVFVPPQEIYQESAAEEVAQKASPSPESTAAASPEATVVASKEIKSSLSSVITPETVTAVSNTTKESVLRELTVEEKMLLKLRAKKEVERDLSGKAQEILNRFYPPNSIIVRINVDLRQAPSSEDYKINELKIKSLTAIILIDNRIDVSETLKQTTYKTVAAAIGYNQARGDKILLQKVPFHLAFPPPETITSSVKMPLPPVSRPGFGWLKIALVALVAGVVVLIIIRLLQMLFSRKAEEKQFSTDQTISPAPAQARPRTGSVSAQLKSAAEKNPEKIAELLRKWLTE